MQYVWNFLKIWLSGAVLSAAQGAGRNADGTKLKESQLIFDLDDNWYKNHNKLTINQSKTNSE